MGYEREAIVDSGTPLPATPGHVMREERVFEPYRTVAKAPKAEVGGQSTTDVAQVAKPAEPGSVTEETVTLSGPAAALARKEQKFRQAEQALKAKDAALEAERAEIADLKALKAKLAAKDYSGIESQVPYNEYTNYLIEKGSSEDPVQAKIKELDSKIDSVEKARLDDVSKRFDAAVAERKKAVVALVDSDAAYSRIKKAGAQEAVLQHILDTWEHDSVDLSPEQAAKEVEELLKERAQKWASLNEESVPAEAAQKQLPPLKTGVKTLTNNMSATGEIKRPVKSFQGMTDAERYAEARRRAEEKLGAQRKG